MCYTRCMRAGFISLVLLGVVTAACGASTEPDARSRVLQYARDDLACTTDADCCVVFDQCRNQGYLVSAADQQKAADLIASADDSSCTACITPPVDVRCGEAGYCVAERINCVSDPVASADHCGAVAASNGDCSVAAQALGSISAPRQTETVIGCGD